MQMVLFRDAELVARATPSATCHEQEVFDRRVKNEEVLKRHCSSIDDR